MFRIFFVLISNKDLPIVFFIVRPTLVMIPKPKVYNDSYYFPSMTLHFLMFKSLIHMILILIYDLMLYLVLFLQMGGKFFPCHLYNCSSIINNISPLNWIYKCVQTFFMSKWLGGVTEIQNLETIWRRNVLPKIKKKKHFLLRNVDMFMSCWL